MIQKDTSVIAANEPKLPRCTIESLKGEHKRHTSSYTPTSLAPSVPWDSQVSDTSLRSPMTPPVTPRRTLEQGRATGSNASKLCKTRSKQEHLIERLCSDYGSELQSHKTDEWLQKEGIIFEPLAPYSQEQNGVSERTGRTLMDMTRASILEGNIDDDLWPEILLVMTYIKNNRPTEALPNNTTPQEAQNQEAPNLSHLRILGSTVYVFLHEEERSKKSEKWAPRALKGTLVGYDGHTIYRVFIKNQNKVIRVKDLQIFKDCETKMSTNLPEYTDTPTFQGFLAEDQEDEGNTPASSRVGQMSDNMTENAQGSTPGNKELQDASSPSGQKVDDNNEMRTGRKVKSNDGSRLGRKVEDTDPLEPVPWLGQKVENTKSLKASYRAKANENAKDPKAAPLPYKSRVTGRTVRLTEKAKAMNDSSSSSRQSLVVQLTELLESWDKNEQASNSHLASGMRDSQISYYKSSASLASTQITASLSLQQD